MKRFFNLNTAIVVGVTDDVADTDLATLPSNPFKHDRCLAFAFGEGVYVEDDGTSRPRQSGVSATGIDVRSSSASKAFICLVVDISSIDLLETDHSATTT